MSRHLVLLAALCLVCPVTAVAQGACPPGSCATGAALQTGRVNETPSAAADALRDASPSPSTGKHVMGSGDKDDFVRSMGIKVDGSGIQMPADAIETRLISSEPVQLSDEPKPEQAHPKPHGAIVRGNRPPPAAPGCGGGAGADTLPCDSDTVRSGTVSGRVQLGTERSVEVASPLEIRVTREGIAVPY